MGVWWQRGRSGRRSSGGFLGQLLESRYDAAEGVLGAVALVLVVWLLWPEEQGPALDERANWQQSVEEADRQRAAEVAERAAAERLRATRDVPSYPSTNSPSSNSIAPDGAETVTAALPAEPQTRLEIQPERRRIARPSELADRLDNPGRWPGSPSPRRPSDVNQPLIDAEVMLQAETAPTEDPGAVDGQIAAAVTAALSEGSSERVSSSEALDAERLPEVDLSDLDALVPLERTETAALTAESDTTAESAGVEPFVIERDPSGPAADVKARPRDDAPSWLKNAVTAAVDDERPIIAVVIDDLGLNRPNTAELNELPGPLTLAFLPYAGRIEAQTEAAHDAGHELMLHLPMEPIGSDWPGPDALTTKIDQAEFEGRLLKNLSRFEGFVGVNNHMGSRLTADRTRMDLLMRELRERDVLFLDSKTSARSVAQDVAGENGVPNTTRDIFLDHVIDLGAIKRQLTLVETVARRTGSAVAIGHPHGVTIEALREWLPSLEARGFALAPISAVVARRACNSGVLIAAETCGRYLQARTQDGGALAATGG